MSARWKHYPKLRTSARGAFLFIGGNSDASDADNHDKYKDSQYVTERFGSK